MNWLEAVQRIQALERRVAGMVRHGAVSEVDMANGLVRLTIAPEADQAFLSPWIPYGQIAGPSTGLKVHTPPVVGQNMTLVSPSGDLRQAVALPMTWSDQAPSPGQGPDPTATYGDFRIEILPDEMKITVPKATIVAGGSTFELTEGGLRLVADKVQIDGTSVKHNAKEIGDGHRHIDSMPGPAKTGVPE